MRPMDKDQFEQLNRKLDLVMKMLAVDKLYGKKQIEQVTILNSFGMRPSEIADILGIRTQNVTAQLAHVKRKASRSRGETNEQE
jgi:transcriptional regulator